MRNPFSKLMDIAENADSVFINGLAFGLWLVLAGVGIVVAGATLLGSIILVVYFWWAFIPLVLVLWIAGYIAVSVYARRQLDKGQREG